jgi:hypothetical protein
MPCGKGKKTVWKVAEAEMKKGVKPKQAFAIAYSEVGEPKKKRRKR